MLGIDSKRDVVKGEFAQKIWSEVVSIWFGKENVERNEEESAFEVVWQ